MEPPNHASSVMASASAPTPPQIKQVCFFFAQSGHVQLSLVGNAAKPTHGRWNARPQGPSHTNNVPPSLHSAHMSESAPVVGSTIGNRFKIVTAEEMNVLGAGRGDDAMGFEGFFERLCGMPACRAARAAASSPSSSSTTVIDKLGTKLSTESMRGGTFRFLCAAVSVSLLTQNQTHNNRSRHCKHARHTWAGRHAPACRALK